MIGEALGNYKVTAKLGSGTMGVVFRAEHVRIARTAAIKVLIPELAQNAGVIQRFFTEARATSLIRHPGIVDVFDCDMDATGRAYIVMEHLDGETLAERLRGTDGGMPWPVAGEIARQIADAIAAAHDNGIIHRDLKPENVFLVRGGARPAGSASVKVLDFGIAKLLAADASARLTMRGMVLGTPEYMAPEQCAGSEDIDGRADIYALGCILFEMLCGEPPFMAETVQELFAGHMFRPVPSIAARAPDLPEWLVELVTAMLAKERGERPASMHEVVRALAAHSETVQDGAPAAEPRWSGRRATLLAAIGGVSALVAAVWITVAALRPPVRRPTSVVPASAATPDPLKRVVLAPRSGSVDETIKVRGPSATADVAAPAPKRVRAAARPQRGARPAPLGASTPKHVMDKDGIVDL